MAKHDSGYKPTFERCLLAPFLECPWCGERLPDYASYVPNNPDGTATFHCAACRGIVAVKPVENTTYVAWRVSPIEQHPEPGDGDRPQSQPD